MTLFELACIVFGLIICYRVGKLTAESILRVPLDEGERLRRLLEAALCSPLYHEVAATLRCDGWSFGDCTARHRSGLKLWTGNGWPFLNVAPTGAGQRLRLIDRWMLRRYLHLARAREIRSDLTRWKARAST